MQLLLVKKGHSKKFETFVVYSYKKLGKKI